MLPYKEFSYKINLRNLNINFLYPNTLKTCPIFLTLTGRFSLISSPSRPAKIDVISETYCTFFLLALKQASKYYSGLPSCNAILLS